MFRDHSLFGESLHLDAICNGDGTSVGQPIPAEVKVSDGTVLSQGWTKDDPRSWTKLVST